MSDTQTAGAQPEGQQPAATQSAAGQLKKKQPRNPQKSQIEWLRVKTTQAREEQKKALAEALVRIANKAKESSTPQIASPEKDVREDTNTTRNVLTTT